MAAKAKVADPIPYADGLPAFGRSLEQYEATAPVRTMERILSIDPGTKNVAVCLFNPMDLREALSSKVVIPDFKTIGAKVRYVEAWLERWISYHRPDLIVKEGVAHYMKFGVADAGRIQYAVERLAIEHDIPLVTVNPTQMRAFLGSREKSDTKVEVFARWGIRFPSEDETDAYAIGQTALAILRGEYPPAKVKKPRKKAAVA